MENNLKKSSVPAVVALLAVLVVSGRAHAVSLIEDAWVELAVKTDRGDSVHISSDSNRLTRVELTFDGHEFCLDVAPYLQLEGPYVQSFKLLIDQSDTTDELIRKVIVPFYSWKGVRRNGLALVATFSGARLVEARVVANNNFDDLIYIFPSSGGS